MVAYDAGMEMARSRVYGFFSAFFLTPPTAEMLTAVLCTSCVEAFEAIFPDHPACARLKELVEAYRSGEWKIEDFLLDYESLFRIPGNGYVHPFESVYAGQNFACGKTKGLAVMAGPAREMAALYREHALIPGEGYCELPDHLGVELEFMAFLCRKAAGALDAGDEERAGEMLSGQISFLRDHLLKWVPCCLDSVRQKAETPLYACVGDLLRAFLDKERSRATEH